MKVNTIERDPMLVGHNAFRRDETKNEIYPSDFIRAVKAGYKCTAKGCGTVLSPAIVRFYGENDIERALCYTHQAQEEALKKHV